MSYLHLGGTLAVLFGMTLSGYGLDITTRVAYPGTTLTDTAININNGGTLTLNQSWSMAGGQTLTLNKGGVLAGSTTANTGSVKNESGTASTVNLYGGTVRQTRSSDDAGEYTFLYYSGNNIGYYINNDGVTFDIQNAGTISRISGTLQDASGAKGKVTKTGTGTLQLYSRNTYTGTTTIQGGKVVVIDSTSIVAESPFSGGFTMAGGTLESQSSKKNLPLNNITSGTSTLLSKSTGKFTDSKAAVAGTTFSITGASTVLNLGDATTAGNLSTTGWVSVGDNAVLNIVNGTNTISGRSTEAQTDGLRIRDGATLNVSGGATTITGHLRLGMSGTGSSMNMTGGTVTVGDTFYAGAGASGNAVLSGGTLDAFKVLVGWYGGDTTLTLNGGTLKCSGTDGIRFGNINKSSMTFQSGTVMANRLGSFDTHNPTVTVNILGKNVTWTNYDGTGNIPKVEFNSGVTTNLTVATNGFSTLTADTVRLGGPVKVSYAGGIGVFDGGYDLVQGTTSFTTGTLTSTGVFTAAKDTDSISIDLNLDRKANATFTATEATLATAATSGWLETPYAAEDLTMNIDLGGSGVTEFLQWLNSETYYDHEATYEDGMLSLGGLSDLAAGDRLFWDFSGFNAGAVKLAGLTGTFNIPVPEPGSWTLLLLGLGWLFRRKVGVGL